MQQIVNRDKPLKLGLYDKRITIQYKQTVTKTSMGDKAEYVDVLTTWAKVNPISVQRLLEYGQMHEDAKYEIEIRYNRTLNITEGEYRVQMRETPTSDLQYFIISSAIDVDSLRKVQRFLVSQNK